jgi:hypothetical protein
MKPWKRAARDSIARHGVADDAFFDVTKKRIGALGK